MGSVGSSRRDETSAPWPEALRLELAAGHLNGRVGQELVSETERVRVWRIELAPGERIAFHRHQLDYFWTAVTAGRSTSRMSNGKVQQTEYYPGKTRHFRLGPGEYFVHDLENTGDTTLVFITVEHKDSANPPLPLPPQ